MGILDRAGTSPNNKTSFARLLPDFIIPGEAKCGRAAAEEAERDEKLILKSSS